MAKFEFGDMTKDDAYCVGDEEVDWSKVEEVAEQIRSIQAVENDEQRLAAAQTWVAKLNGAA
jgi:hypothetical protein